jgi:hypothetical protein
VPPLIYDACVLYPAPLRDLLMRIARSGLVRARWTTAILDECFSAILRDRPDLEPDKLKKTREAMIDAVSDCLISGFEGLISGLVLPDADDRHVLAAAIHAGATTIVTWNRRDFPKSVTDAHGIRVQSPDDLIFDLVQRFPGRVSQLVREQAGALRNPPQSPRDLLDTLRRQGLERSVVLLQAELR